MKHLFPIILSIGLTLAVAITPGTRLQASASPVSMLSTQIDITGPPGSGKFGKSVTVLPNGNFVVTDPYYDLGSTVDVGAVYLYDGASGTLISTLTGSTTSDQVGYAVKELTNGSYVVSSPYWDNGGATDAGAVTWCSGTIGCTGTISVTNSLAGSTAGDQVGYYVTALSNGNYVVGSQYWNNGGATDAGAVTWCSGTIGCTGTVSATNSLVGSTADDWVGSYSGVTELSNGNYVVRSPAWDNGGVTDAGAATWGDGTTGITGTVSATNSLVGSTTNDWVGYVIALSNGNYVVSSQYWDNGGTIDAGAATWANGTTGITGTVSATNSLVGSTANDMVGSGVTTLSNGNYVVYSPSWDNGAVADAGAVTWGDGTMSTSGVVSSTNSLVGSTAGDMVGWSVTALSNGNYVVCSPIWDNGGTADAGAATWGDGTTSVSGVVSSTNSLVGSTANDRVGGFNRIVALSNGNYVVPSPDWDNATGAATWGDGTTGISGVVTNTNSLVGSTASDGVGGSVTALSNGNYVVRSLGWDNGAVTNAGAATWGDGTVGVSGVVSSTNSLVGSTANDRVGFATALSNGNYVVSSQHWDNGAVEDTGAVTWCSGIAGCTGAVSSTNSLVGSTANDGVGGSVTALSNGDYVVHSREWDNGGATDAGAVTWCIGSMGCIGPITADNSVLGTTASGGSSQVFAYDPINFQLVVGRPKDNIVTLFRPYQRVFVPLVMQ